VEPAVERPRLPSGRHHLTRQEVAAHQRRRLLDAAAEVFAERGALGTTSREIAERARVSSSTFYAHFESLEQALALSYALAAKSLRECIEETCAREPESRVEAAIEVTLVRLANAPAQAALFGLEAVVAVAAAAPEWDRLTHRLGELVALGSVAGSQRSRSGVGKWLAAAALVTASEWAVAGPGESPTLAAELATTIALA
jgi:AcrR family transcriptional regulator